MSMDEYIKKAGILVEALPYIQKLYDKTIVVKYGGNAMINDTLKKSVMEDITLLKYVGMHPIVVHGGGPDISGALKRMDIKSEFINGLRVTDEETMAVAQMVLVGKTNKEVVSNLNAYGGKAVGFCGIDGHIIECEKETTMVDDKEVDLGYVGKITKIDTHLLKLVAEDAYIPVIAPIGVDKDEHSYNINADTVASAVACALKAEKLILLTDVEGIKTEEGNVLYEITKEQVFQMIEDKTITSGMIPKVLSCIDAIDSGVNRVHIIDGRVPHSILLEIFTDTGIGTMFRK